MKKIILLPIIIMILVVVTGVQSCKNGDTSAGSVLKFNPEKNKQYDYEIMWDMNQKVMDRDSKINLLTGYSFEVTDDKDNIKTLKGVYKNFKLYMKIMDMEMDIDTGKPVDNMTGDDQMAITKKLFAGIKGKAFIMKVDEEGKVLSVSGVDEIINGMIDSSQVNEDLKLQMRASLQDQFNEQELKNQFAQVFMIFPNKRVKMGDSWQKNYRMGGKTPGNFSTTYTVNKIEADQLTLDAKTVITPAGGEMEVTGTQTGTLLVDGKNGLVIHAEFNQDMDAKMKDFGIKINVKGMVRGRER